MTGPIVPMTYPVTDSHVPRKLFHLLGASVIPTLFLLEPFPRERLLIALMAITVLWIVFDIARLGLPYVNRMFQRCFGGLMKTRERGSLMGVSYLLAGSLASLLLFPVTTAITVLYFMAIGDPVAAVIGKEYGKRKIIHGRTLEGSFAMFVVCAGVGAMVMGFSWAVMAGAMTAAIAELFTFGKLDDNLTVPLFSGAAITLIEMVSL